MVKQESGTTRIPLAGIDAVVLLGSGQVTSDALAACVRRGVRVASLRRSGALRFVVGGPLSGNVHLRMAQHTAVLSEEHSLTIAQAVVAAKLQSSRTTLLRWSRDAKSPSAGQRLKRRAEMIAERITRVPGAGSGDHLRGWREMRPGSTSEGSASTSTTSAFASAPGPDDRPETQ